MDKTSTRDDNTNHLDQAISATPIARVRRRKSTKRAEPTHYKVICISMYTSDLDELDEKVKELKRRGMTKMSKSQLIRVALSRLDLAAIG